MGAEQATSEAGAQAGLCSQRDTRHRLIKVCDEPATARRLLYNLVLWLCCHRCWDLALRVSVLPARGKTSGTTVVGGVGH